MRTRQRILISLLLHAPVEPGRTQLMKWLFLLKQEDPLSKDPTFYDFVPYRYGPFSFEAYRELDELARLGLLQSDALRIRPETADSVRAAEDALPPRVREAVSQFLQQYGVWSTNRLVAFVYSRYPWYASRSRRQASPREKRIASPAVYTIGYEGRSVDGFLDHLLQEGIIRLVDVRSNPFSRKYGFSKDSLRRLTADVGVKYVHFPDLGIASSLRKGVATPEAHQRLLDYYQSEILHTRSRSVEQAGRLLAGEASALMCFEADVRCCHRGRLAGRLAALTGLPVVHL